MAELFESVKKRAKELGVKKIVVASSIGDSAKGAVKELGTKDYEIIVVTDRAEVVWDVGSMSEKMRREYEIKTGAKEYPSGIAMIHQYVKNLRIWVSIGSFKLLRFSGESMSLVVSM